MILDHLVIIAEDAARHPAGFIGGYVIPHPYNPATRLLAEAFWWVSEEHRGSRAGAMLFKSFVEWGKANADWITMALEHHSPVKEETLTKRGFRLQERSYLLEVS